MNPYLDSAWFGQIRRTRRSDPIYEPALLLAVIDMIAEGVATTRFVPMDILLARFDELLVRAGLDGNRGPGRGHMPAYHLSSSSRTEEPFWNLVRCGAPVGQQHEPSSNKVLISRADGLQLDDVLADELMAPSGVELARAAIHQLLEDDGRADCIALLNAHDEDVRLVKEAVERLTQQEVGPFQLDDPNARRVGTFREQFVRDRSLRLTVAALHRASSWMFARPEPAELPREKGAWS